MQMAMITTTTIMTTDDGDDTDDDDDGDGDGDGDDEDDDDNDHIQQFWLFRFPKGTRTHKERPRTSRCLRPKQRRTPRHVQRGLRPAGTILRPPYI